MASGTRLAKVDLWTYLAKNKASPTTDIGDAGSATQKEIHNKGGSQVEGDDPSGRRLSLSSLAAATTNDDCKTNGNPRRNPN